MSTPQRAPRSRSAFGAAFLSLLFPGLGHAYAGAYMRALAFAAPPLLALALTGGILLRVDKVDLLAFLVNQPVLIGLLVANVALLLYRIVAAVDAWQVARFLNAVDASGGGRLGRARLPLSPLSIAGLLAVVLVMAGGHVAVARYNVMALDLVGCVFSDGGDPSCTAPEDSPAPGDSAAASGTPTESPAASDLLPQPSPMASGAVGSMAPTLPPWDGKERLNILLVGNDQRPGDSSFNTDTMIVVSVDPVTKQVAMFQLPRDMTNVPVPANARAVWGSVYAGKINSWFTQNRNRTDLWPGKTTTARGFSALKAMLGGLYGLDIRYYVMVNFGGFRKVVDALGGIQVNVQIPVAESQYPAASGALRRVYIPAGPQHMSGAAALVYARSRHRAAGGDFDRGLRQQRVLLSLREQMNARSIIGNLPALVNALKTSVTTDIPVDSLARMLTLAESVDTKNIRSYMFSPPYYGTDMWGPSGGTDSRIVLNAARVRRAVKDAFTADPALIALRDRLSAEGAQAWVVNASGKSGLAASVADYFGYYGVEASAPNRTAPTAATTKIVVYNGAEATMPQTIKYLEDTLGVQATTATDPTVTVDMIVTLGKNAPDLQAPVVG
ncbi:MAG TPA: LCP family protein [Candidatus Limnocylindrales bacterium]